ncbi:hypothetical protein F993_00062 [Acinetobacter proteolyticus]|uniref:DUF599 domain-containing protein n=1 Tax=Acinetobacter proteolyticus TaxID=1776741 RepID=A0ABP2TT87_9GAMM|nr:hypothetical protein [Acinetobacter proteolyticus]ENU25288.1 hypothetical protein F993_00062 [Acinetobacter proteolyticus]
MEKFLLALQTAASNPLAYAAYIVTIITWFLIAWRVHRHQVLLNHISLLPEKDRLTAISLEMGTVQVKGGVSAEQWLRSRIHTFYLVGFCVVCLTTFAIITLTFYVYNGSVSGSIGLEN